MSEDEVLEDAAPPPMVSEIPAAPDDLDRAADPALTEDLALALLKRTDLTAAVIELLAKNRNALKSRKVRIAVATHPRAPRHVSVPLARRFYTFDLMRVALSPSVPSDVKIAVDGVLISRLKTVTLGERMTLARRASGRVAAALLMEVERGDGKTAGAKAIRSKVAPRDPRVMQTALDNPRLTEALIINSVLLATASTDLVHAVAHHPKWSLRKEVRAALLRTEHLSLASALEFGREIPVTLLQELLNTSRLPVKIKDQLLRERRA
jgi:hypothetical protein